MSDSTTDEANRDLEYPADATLSRRRVLSTAGVAAGATLGVGTTSAAGREGRVGTRNRVADAADTEPMVIAHRGFAGVYPENTVGAVTAASTGGASNAAGARGADMIEMDVVPTADGDVVVFHDSRLAERDGGERGLTDTTGVVWEQSTETVTSAEVLDSGERVPLLTDILDAIPTDVAVNIELKNPGSFDLRFAADLSDDDLQAQMDLWRPFVESVLDIADEYANDVLVSSFYEAALATTRELSSYPVAPLLWDSIEDGLAIARTYDAEAIHPPYNMVQGTPFYADPYYTEGSNWSDTDLLAVAHDEGRDVNVYTLDTWYQARRLAAAGVDGLIVNYPNLLAFGAHQ